MENTTIRTGYFLIALLVLTFFGFYLTYFGTFPQFEGISFIQHFHALIFLSWFALLIAQPFLIRYKITAMHRLVGKASYFLMPIVIFSIYLASKGQFERGASQAVPLNQNLASTFMPMMLAFLFGFFYVLSMLNTHNWVNHVRYIIASSLVLLGPSFGRIFILWFQMSPHDGIWYGGMLICDISLLILAILDKLHGVRGHAYAIALAVSASGHLAWFLNFQETALWQAIADVLF